MRNKSRRINWARVWTVTIILAVLAGIGGCATWYFNTESGQRTIKTWKSNNAGGLERTVDVYDQSGNLLRQYRGKIDTQENEYGNKVLFDLNGKRIVIYNGVVIAEEVGE